VVATTGDRLSPSWNCSISAVRVVLLGHDAHGVVGQPQLGSEVVLQMLGHLGRVVLVDAEHDCLAQGVAGVEQVGQVRADDARAVGQGDVALELALVVAVFGLGVGRHEHVRALLLGVGQGQPLLVDVGLHAVYFIGGQEAVADALRERVAVDRLAKVGVGVDVVRALGRGGHAQVDRAREVGEDGFPGAEAGAVRLVDDDQVEEVARVALEQARRRAAGRIGVRGRGLGVEGLVHGEVDVARRGGLALVDDGAGVLEGGEGVVGLVAQHDAVGQEQDAPRAAGARELPGDLQGHVGLAGPRGHGQQDAPRAGGDGRDGLVDGDLLVVARALAVPLIVGHDQRVQVCRPPLGRAPAAGDGGLGIGGGIALVQLVGRRESVEAALRPRAEVELFDAMAVAAVGEQQPQLLGVQLGLLQAGGRRELLFLGLDHGERERVTVAQEIVGLEGLPAPGPVADEVDLPLGEIVLALDALFVPPSGVKPRVDQLGARVRFVVQGVTCSIARTPRARLTRRAPTPRQRTG